ncbi:MAG: MBL fold metallo-hydrolase [Candidatus Cloacimonetes bacterium]|nr:MBL fold metallo-hydrolase [Candidatus Cloacimonadota bacterium]
MKKKPSVLFVGLLFLCSSMYGQNNALPPWQEGYLDIHHISTGRGNASFILFPDGTSFVVDCGDMSETQTRVLSEKNTPLVPDDSKTPAQWVADYIYQFHPKRENAIIDYVLITHYHDDHFGEVDNLRKRHPDGGYLMAGITELGSIIPIKKIIDRGSDFPVNFRDEEVQKKIVSKGDPYSMIATLNEYWKFIDFHKKNRGMFHEKFTVGSNNQIRLNYKPEQFYDFKVKNIFANGEVWDELNNKTHVYIKPEEYRYNGENNELSTGIKISYGSFDYYTGGDIGGIDQHGQDNPNSMETKTAPVIGAVDVATLNHHGNRGSMNTFFVKCLRPSVWIGQTWDASHPGGEVLRRITSRSLYPGERDVFANAMLESTKLVIGSMVDKSYKSQSGHLLVRVYPGGNNYSVFVLDDKTAKRNVKAKFNYSSK